jgi:hypothetical protein
MKKICSKCGIEKELSEFHKDKRLQCGVGSICKKCKVIYQKSYNSNNKHKKIKYDKIYRDNNKEKISLCQKEYQKEYYIKNKEHKKEYIGQNKERIAAHNKEYYIKNKDKINIQKRKCENDRLISDSYFKLSHNLRIRIRQAFKLYSKNGKTKSCKEYGIDFKAIYEHVGPKPDGDYHLDHIIPISVFDLDNPEHVRLAHLPRNLRWLDAKENLSKNDKLDWFLINNCVVLQMIAKEIDLTTQIL